jgi:PleD family two-component response regulator
MLRVAKWGGRMLTYNDLTDLVSRAEHLATLDGLTGLHNRRHFEALAKAEWSRFAKVLLSTP